MKAPAESLLRDVVIACRLVVASFEQLELFLILVYLLLYILLVVLNVYQFSPHFTHYSPATDG